jgi:hypothetical protein
VVPEGGGAHLRVPAAEAAATVAEAGGAERQGWALRTWNLLCMSPEMAPDSVLSKDRRRFVFCNIGGSDCDTGKGLWD